jgi:hypothetical protein
MFWIILRSGRDALVQHMAAMHEGGARDDVSDIMNDDESGLSSKSKGSRSRHTDDDSDDDSSAIDSEADSTRSGRSSSDYSSSSDSEVEVEAAEPTNLDPMVVYGPPPPLSDFTYKLKIFLGFLQIMTNLSSGLEVQWPNTFKEFVLLFNVVNMDFLFSDVTSAQCLFSADFYYSRFTVVVVTPVVLLVVAAVLLVLPTYCGWTHHTVMERSRNMMKVRSIADHDDITLHCHATQQHGERGD